MSTMRELAIGDIHGCARTLQVLLEKWQPRPEDTVILLGDYINRGADSCGVIELILELNRQCTVVALAGNHEKMLLDARRQPAVLREFLKKGGDTMLDSYERHGYARGVEGIPARHWKFFAEGLLDFWETEETIFVHAAVDPELAMAEQPQRMLFWEKFRDPMVHCSGKPVVCGHASQKDGRPAFFRGGVCIDSWAWRSGWLTGLDVGTRRLLQVNERGEERWMEWRLTDGAGNGGWGL